MDKKKKELIKGAILSAFFVGIVLIGIFVLGNNSTKIEKRKIQDVIAIETPTNIDYSHLNTDNDEKTTFGKNNVYSVSCSIEDGYAKATEEYGSIEKATRKLKSEKEKENEIDFEHGIDGYLFTYYLLSYLGGISKNVGIPTTEEIVTFDSGDWLHYYNFPLKENGDKFEVYITWNDGIFYFVEFAYQDEFPKDALDSIANAKFTIKQNGFIPYTPSLN